MSLTPFRGFNDSSDWLVHDPFRDEFFGRHMPGMDITKSVSPLLSMDLVENDNDFKVLADLPGVDPSEIDLTIEQNALVMKAERKHEHEDRTDKFHRLERSYGNVQRRIALPKNADMDHAQTQFSNGVLTVTFPKLHESPRHSRKLAINSA